MHNDLFYEGYDDLTFQQAMEECQKEYDKGITELDEKYPDFEAQKDELNKLMDGSREITKRLNILLNK